MHVQLRRSFGKNNTNRNEESRRVSHVCVYLAFPSLLRSEMIGGVRRFFLWIVLVGAVVVVVGVLWQAFSIAAYVRGAGEGALDAHLTGSFFVHAGELAVVIGAIVAFWGRWWAVAGAVGFLVLSVAQIAFLGDTDKQGGWINGLHGFLALIILLCGVAYASSARRALGLWTRPQRA